MAHVCLPLCSLLQRADVPHFIRCDSRSTSSWEWVARVASLSHALTLRLALGEGAVVMVASLNTDWLLEAVLAALDAGLVACTVNHRWSSNELSGAMALSQPAAIFTDAHCSQLVQQAMQLHLKGSDGARPPVVIQLGTACPALQLPAAVPILACQEMMHLAQLQHQAQLQSTLALGGSSLPMQLKQPASGAAMICFTSGTTGKPKGVLLSHTAFHTQSMAKLAVVGYNSTETYMHVAPLFHIGGLSSAFACIMAGACHVLLPKYTATEALRCIQQYRVTSMIAVPAIMQDLLTLAHRPAHMGDSGSTPLTLLSVRCILMGGGVTTSDLLARMATTFPNATVLSAYGMTEACSSMTFHTLIPQQRTAAQSDCSTASHELWVGAACAGWPAPGIAIRIVPVSEQSPSSDAPTDSATLAGSTGSCGSHGNHLMHQQQHAKSHEDHLMSQQQHADSHEHYSRSREPTPRLVVGEVWTRGPHTLLEYWNSPAETQQVYAAGGWLRTGDVGFLDHHGALWLKGRAKDMIKSGGENVYAAEVESALTSHPCVVAAVVVGAPHPTWGEQVCALLVLAPDVAWQGVRVDPAIWHPSPSAQPQQAQGVQLQQTQSEHTSGSVNTAGGADTHSTRSGLQVVNAEVLQAHCRHVVKLSPYKLPRFIAAVQSSHEAFAAQGVLPVNASGKVLKDKVKAALLDVFSTQAHQVAANTLARSRL